MNATLLLLTVLLLGTSQILQKLGAERRLSGQNNPRSWLAALLSPELLGAGFTIIAGTAVWLVVLYRMDVSQAFPLLSLTSVLVVATSRVLLKEQVSGRRWLGVALIAIGIALVAGS